MKILFKGDLREQIEVDLRRPSTVAFERIGFIFGAENNGIIILDEYYPVDDEDYIASEIYGAVFNKEAIKKTLKRILVSKKSCFQVHEHSTLFGPRFSKPDLITGQELCQAFNSFNSNVIHGSLILCGYETNVMYINKDGKINQKLFTEEV